MALGALLKYRCLVERPFRFLESRPIRIRVEQACDFLKVGLVVGPEVERGARESPFRHGREEFQLHHTILVVTSFWPGIREEYEDRTEPGVLGHHGEEVICLGAHEVQVFNAAAGALPVGADDAVGGYVDSDAYFLWMRLCVGRKEMPMPASDFPDKALLGLDENIQRAAQLAASLVNV
jgi:hypothetical protein